jgi:ribosomal protein S18 acetylase RimI-like enzyme
MGFAVRRAGMADLDDAAGVLTEAFADYPWTRWTVEGYDHARRVEGLQRLIMEHVALPYGEVWVVVDEHDNIASVAIWSLPAIVVPASVFDTISLLQVSLEGDRHSASVAADAAIARLRPPTYHYYLGAVGTRPDYQRLGLGIAVLTPILDRADAEGADVYLETSALSNVAFYRKLGFVTLEQMALPGGGPNVWAMLRTPRTPVL